MTAFGLCRRLTLQNRLPPQHGKYRKGEEKPDTLRAKFFPKAMSDEGSLDKVEQLIPLAQSAGMSLMHMALGFVMAHPALTSAIIGPRTMEQLDGLLAGAEVVLDDELLDRIDEIVPPGVDVAPLEGAAYSPPSITQASLRRACGCLTGWRGTYSFARLRQRSPVKREKPPSVVHHSQLCSMARAAR
jgi:hypothetical protein